MLALAILLALASLAVCCFAPGFFFLRRARWSPMEKLCGSVGLSLILLYLVNWSAYCLGVGAAPAIAVACVLLGGAAWRDAVRLFRNARVGQAALGFGFLMAWTLLLLAIVRNYNGGGWFGDWLEHFQRSLFFLHRFPLNTKIFNPYPLPARPPMENVLAAFFMALAGDRFEVFQVVLSFLNLLMFLPCCLVLTALTGRKSRILPLVAIFALNPVVMVATTYTWTKALAAFYVVLALAFYLAAWRKRSMPRMLAAFAFVSAGVLAHYSTGPYALFLAVHYMVFVFWKRERKWRELAAIVELSVALLGTWFAWSLATYGWHATVATNSSVVSSQAYEGSNFVKIAANLRDTIVPLVLRNPAALREYDQLYTPGAVRDYAFVFYQTNAVFGMGLIGGPLILWLLWRAFAGTPRPERRFWAMLIPFSVVAGVAVVGERDAGGVAHLTLLAIEILGLTWLAARFRASRFVGIAIMIGCAADFGLGVFLHARVENLENSSGRKIFAGLTSGGGVYHMGGGQLTDVAERNWYRKHQYALCVAWMRDLERYPANPVARQLLEDIGRQKRQDETYFHGWYSRHGGSLGFLGDRFAGAGWALLLLLAGLFGALEYGLWRGLAPRPVRARQVKKRYK